MPSPRPRPRHLLAAGAAALLAILGPAGGSSSAVGAVHAPPRLIRLTATPPLQPAYSPDVHDYVVRCAGTKTVRLSTWAAVGTRPSIAGRTGHTATVALEPGGSVTVEGRSADRATSYHVRCLPADFPDWQVSGAGTGGRFYIATPTLSIGGPRSHYVVVFDGHGVPVWWYRDPGVPLDAKLLPDGLLAYATFDAPDPAYQLRRLDGTLAGRITSPDGQIDDHELQLRGNGDRIFLVYQPKSHVDLSVLGGPADATVLEGRIEELSPAGKLVWSWSTDGNIPLAESASWAHSIVSAPIALAGGVQAYDVFHANSVSLLGNLVLLSLRYTNAVYGIDRSSGRILWKLGGTTTPQSLAVVGDPYASAPFSGQHDARLLPDGTVTVFDDESFVGRPPRVVHYRIDTSARTATLLSSISDPEVTSSPCCGSARLLADGGWLVSWGGDPVFGEYASDGTPLLRITFDGYFSYRVTPVAAGRLTAAMLRAGMDAMAARAR